MTRKALLAALLALLAGFDCAAVAGERIAVIVASGDLRNDSSKAELASIFRRKLLIDASGRSIVPVNLPAANPLRVAFSVAVLGRLPENMQAYWNEEYFHGVSPPPTLNSQEAVLRFVATTPGAIGYVLGCDVDTRVKVIATIDVPDDYPVPTSACSHPAATPGP
jgi:hypothetical protein